MQEDDILPLFEMGLAQWGHDEWLTQRYLSTSFAQPGWSFTAKCGGKIIGGIIAVEVDIVPQWIRYLIVDHQWRRSGIASALLKHVMEQLSPGSSVHVDTGVKDAPALAFYHAQGFIKQGRIRSFYGEEDAYVFCKPI